MAEHTTSRDIGARLDGEIPTTTLRVRGGVSSRISLLSVSSMSPTFFIHDPPFTDIIYSLIKADLIPTRTLLHLPSPLNTTLHTRPRQSQQDHEYEHEYHNEALLSMIPSPIPIHTVFPSILAGNMPHAESESIPCRDAHGYGRGQDNQPQPKERHDQEERCRIRTPINHQRG
jgi:hypothetical protein